MNTGTVKFFNADKAYAFIRLDEGRDVFIHSSWILGDGWQTLEVGHRVEFAPGGNGEAQNRNPV